MSNEKENLQKLKDALQSQLKEPLLAVLGDRLARTTTALISAQGSAIGVLQGRCQELTALISLIEKEQ